MGDIENSVEDKTVERRRHKEILDRLDKVASKLQPVDMPRDDAELKLLIKSLGSSHDVFIKKVGELQKQELPKNEINVTTDNKELIQSFRIIADEVINSNEKLISKIDEMIVESKRGKTFELKTNRHHFTGLIDSINGEIK